MRSPLIAVVVIVSAFGAAFAGGSPTGWVPLDVVLLMTVGAGASLAASVAPPPWLLLTSLATAVASRGSPAAPLALAGGMFAVVGLRRRSPAAMNAAIGGLVAQTALRLADPAHRGASAIVATLLLGAVVVPALGALSGGGRRRLRRIAVGLGGAALVAAGIGAVAALSAVGPLRRGLTAVNGLAGVGTDADRQTAADAIRSASEEFSTAQDTLESWWARPAAAVPLVAQHFRVLRGAAASGIEVATAAGRALTAPAIAQMQVRDGQIPFDQLAALQPSASEVADTFTAARRRLERSRSPWLIPQLSRSLDLNLGRTAAAETTTRALSRTLPLLPGLLGKDGPRRYFLAVQNTAEARASGGLIGNFGEVTAEDGRLSLVRFGRNLELTRNNDGISGVLRAPPDFESRYGRFLGARLWSNVNVSPDFPTNAAVIADLYPQSRGAPVDGVIAIDPAGLAAFLRLMPPIEVPGWPAPISGDNVEQVLLHDQYLAFDTPDRVDFLGDVAQGVWHRLTTGNLPALPQLVAALGPAVQAKHLMLFSTHPVEQSLFEDIHAAGKMAPVRGDFLGVVTQNTAGNKIDYFLRRHVDYWVELDPRSGRVNARVKLVLQNDAPASGLPSYVIGNDRLLPIPDGSNRLDLSFYTPWKLDEAWVDGTAASMASAADLDRQVHFVTVVVPPMGSTIVELRLSGKLPKGSPYRLDIHRQPTVVPDEMTTTLSVGGAWRTADGGSTRRSHMRLSADATLNVDLRRR
jgi:hypothetical protein